MTISSLGNATFPQTITVTGGNGLQVPSNGQLYFNGNSMLKAPSSGIIGLYNHLTNNFDRLQFGGTTSSFPSLQRSGTGLISRLADDSANAPFTASNLIATGQVGVGTASPNASAAVDITSTTQGLLLPRMTTVQRDAITPVDGLMIFCTDCTATDASTGVSQTYSSSQWRNHY